MGSIGLITFHSAHNYGAMLQVYALQEKLRELNYNVQIINYRNNKIDDQYRVWNIKGRNPLNLIKKTINSIKYYQLNNNRYINFNCFMNEKLNLSREYTSIEDLQNEYPKFDIYITGSDQVWNPNIVGELSDAYTLNFGDKKIKKISYAASIGTSTIDEKYINDYKNKISKIDRISVREEDAKESLSKIINNKVEVVLDPTLLLKKEEWELKIKENNKENEKYILAYVVKQDEEYKKIVNYLSEKTGLKVIHFERDNNYSDVLRSAYSDAPLNFINLIKNAEYVVATSFHATVFSIIFNKKFFVIPHNQTGSRVTNLLDKLDINDRVVYTLDEFKNRDYNLKIDYEKVNNILAKEREKSINWLKYAIEN